LPLEILPSGATFFIWLARQAQRDAPAVSDILKNPKLLVALFVLAMTLDILLGQGDGGDAFFQGFLDMLHRMGLW
jgi:hypothetical protein